MESTRPISGKLCSSKVSQVNCRPEMLHKNKDFKLQEIQVSTCLM